MNPKDKSKLPDSKDAIPEDMDSVVSTTDFTGFIPAAQDQSTLMPPAGILPIIRRPKQKKRD